MSIARITIIMAFYAFPAINSEPLEHGTLGVDWVMFKDYEGKHHIVNMSISLEDVKLAEKTRRISDDANPIFWLYTRKRIDDPENLILPTKSQTSFEPRDPLIILVGGWLTKLEGNSTQVIKNTILKKMHRGYNVVIMDWIDMQSMSYIATAKQTLKVAEKLEVFVTNVATQYRVPKSNIHLIGHSLGAHVVGLAGLKLRRNNFIVSRVTGLDPARPFFEIPAIYPGITKDSAVFVDIIHTSAPILGIRSPAGHADFYPGGGKIQPSICTYTRASLGWCEHKSSYLYFEKSLYKKFKARKCVNYQTYEAGQCDQNEIQYMGSPCDTGARGSFFLDIY